MSTTTNREGYLFMTVGELLLREGIKLPHTDRNRIGILVGRKAKELGITTGRKAESYLGKDYTANDYEEDFGVQMLIIVREYMANPPEQVPPKKIAVEQSKKKVEPVSKPKAEEVKHVQREAGKKRQQEWLEKRKKKG